MILLCSARKRPVPYYRPSPSPVTSTSDDDYYLNSPFAHSPRDLSPLTFAHLGCHRRTSQHVRNGISVLHKWFVGNFWRYHLAITSSFFGGSSSCRSTRGMLACVPLSFTFLPLGNYPGLLGLLCYSALILVVQAAEYKLRFGFLCKFILKWQFSNQSQFSFIYSAHCFI